MYKFSQVIKRILKDLIENIITQGINLKVKNMLVTI